MAGREDRYSNAYKKEKKNMDRLLSKRKWFGGGKGKYGFGNMGVTDQQLKDQGGRVRDASRNIKTDGGRTHPMFKKTQKKKD